VRFGATTPYGSPDVVSTRHGFVSTFYPDKLTSYAKTAASEATSLSVPGDARSLFFVPGSKCLRERAISRLTLFHCQNGLVAVVVDDPDVEPGLILEE
jgi:hypothetical protein